MFMSGFLFISLLRCRDLDLNKQRVLLMDLWSLMNFFFLKMLQNLVMRNIRLCIQYMLDQCIYLYVLKGIIVLNAIGCKCAFYDWPQVCFLWLPSEHNRWLCWDLGLASSICYSLCWNFVGDWSLFTACGVFY